MSQSTFLQQPQLNNRKQQLVGLDHLGQGVLSEISSFLCLHERANYTSTCRNLRATIWTPPLTIIACRTCHLRGCPLVTSTGQCTLLGQVPGLLGRLVSVGGVAVAMEDFPLLTSLVTLDLSSFGFFLQSRREFTRRLQCVLTELPHLRSLSITHMDLTLDDLRLLIPLMTTKLVRLDLSHTSCASRGQWPDDQDWDDIDCPHGDPWGAMVVSDLNLAGIHWPNMVVSVMQLGIGYALNTLNISGASFLREEMGEDWLFTDNLIKQLDLSSFTIDESDITHARVAEKLVMSGVTIRRKNNNFPKPLSHLLMRCDGCGDCDPPDDPRLRTLIWLDLSGVDGLYEVDGLHACTKLRHLDISDTLVENVTSLLRCSELRYLDLKNTSVADMTPITRNCPLLKYLNIASSKVQDLDLGYFPRLVTFIAYGTRVHDLSTLARCKHLTHLNVGNTLVSCIASLEQCTKLVHVCLTGTQVTDITPLSHSRSSLEMLMVQSTKLPLPSPASNTTAAAASVTSTTASASGSAAASASDATPSSAVQWEAIARCRKLEHLFVDADALSSDSRLRLLRACPDIEINM